MFRERRSALPKWFVDTKVEIKESEIHGLGCFAKEDIEANVLIESCPVIVFHRENETTVIRRKFFRYNFPFW